MIDCRGEMNREIAAKVGELEEENLFSAAGARAAGAAVA